MVIQSWVNNAVRRAHVLDVLLASPHAQYLSLSAVNGRFGLLHLSLIGSPLMCLIMVPHQPLLWCRLETPLHCALRSYSTLVTKALIEHGTCVVGAVSPRLQTASMVQVDAVDGDNWLPLDLAVTTSSWFAVSLLIKNNAHMASPS